MRGGTMKKKYFCPMCGNREAIDLFITTHKGKRLSLLLASQANIRKSQGHIGCLKCKHVGKIKDFQASPS